MGNYLKVPLLMYCFVHYAKGLSAYLSRYPNSCAHQRYFVHCARGLAAH